LRVITCATGTRRTVSPVCAIARARTECRRGACRRRALPAHRYDVWRATCRCGQIGCRFDADDIAALGGKNGFQTHAKRHWLTGQLASEVPLDIALCEHGCRKSQCLQEEWEHCERRLASIKGMQAAASEKAKAKPRKQAVAGKRKAARKYARRSRSQAAHVR